MNSEYLVYRKKSTPFVFRIIESHGPEWAMVRIYELTFCNFSVEKKCIAKDDEMQVNGNGRKIFSHTKFEIDSWVKVAGFESLKDCVTCENIECPHYCKNWNYFLTFNLL